YNNTAWDIIKPDPEPPGMKGFQILKDSLSALPYWRMKPSNELAVGGPCLASVGEAYAFYLEGTSITINLAALEEGLVSAVWVNTWTGERLKASPVKNRILKLRKPEAFGSAPALLLVRRQSL